MKNSKSESPSTASGPRGSNVKKASAASLGATLLLVVAYLIATWLGIPLDGLLSQSPEQPTPEQQATTQQRPADAAGATTVDSAADAESFRIENVTVRNRDGKVVFEGTVDLTETMRRIDAGRRLGFRNDGTTFQNRERRLPSKERGYYKEFVHPTPQLSGPGPQRVVTGKQREAYYTFDHYETFQRIR